MVNKAMIQLFQGQSSDQIHPQERVLLTEADTLNQKIMSVSESVFELRGSLNNLHQRLTSMESKLRTPPQHTENSGKQTEWMREQVTKLEESFARSTLE